MPKIFYKTLLFYFKKLSFKFSYCRFFLKQTKIPNFQDILVIHVIFYFHKVEDSKIVLESRHPRNNLNLPKVGIFAQRAKNRLNKIGITVCEVLKVEKNKLTVKGLDAIDGTPILDIKPYMVEFDLRDSKQPLWTNEIMKKYF